MDDMNIALGFENIGVGLLIILISIPLLLGKVPMNRWYGVRFKASYESDDNWYAINRYGAKWLIIWSIVLMVIGAIAFFVPLEGNVTRIAIFSYAPLIVIIPAIQSYIYSRRLSAKSRP